MKTRKQFLAAAVSAGALLAAPAGAQTAATPTPAPTPARKPSEAAAALAARMRAFDPKLTDEDLATIAEGIDGNFQIGRAVNPKGTAVPNWIEPATAFRVIES